LHLLSFRCHPEERSDEERFSLARFSSDESLFACQLGNITATRHAFYGVGASSPDKKPARSAHRSRRRSREPSARRSHQPLTTSPCLNPFVVIPTERSDEGPLFAVLFLLAVLPFFFSCHPEPCARSAQGEGPAFAVALFPIVLTRHVYLDTW